MRKEYKNNVPWKAVQDALEENFGFWDEIELSEEQETRLKSVYEKTLKGQKAKMEKSEYAQDEVLAAEAKRIINEIALIGWTMDQRRSFRRICSCICHRRRLGKLQRKTGQHTDSKTDSKICRIHD